MDQCRKLKPGDVVQAYYLSEDLFEQALQDAREAERRILVANHQSWPTTFSLRQTRNRLVVSLRKRGS
jgi:hypothetical protein